MLKVSKKLENFMSHLATIRVLARSLKPLLMEAQLSILWLGCHKLFSKDVIKLIQKYSMTLKKSTQPKSESLLIRNYYAQK
jgi:hypothetical protein